MNSSQIAAIAIFLLAYSGIIALTKWGNWKVLPPVVGAIIVSLFVLTPHQVWESENFETLLFVFGMMGVIETMHQAGFFRWLGLHVVRAVRLDPLAIFVVLPLLTAFMSSLVDSITVMLFMSTLTIEICRLTKTRPLPLILHEICAANIGGASTMVGDPPNVILGTYFNLSFMDFVVNTGPIALIALAVNTMFFLVVFHREILSRRRAMRQDPAAVDALLSGLHPQGAIQNRHLFWVGILAFVYVVVMLITHHLSHLSVATVALTGFCISAVLAMRKIRHILVKIDYFTILFFAALFIIVGGLEHTGVLKIVAGKMLDMAGGNFFLVLTILLWFSAITSSVVDNVPLAATLAPLIHHLNGAAGFPLMPMVWTTAIGTDIGGNGTRIGASANVVALEVYEKTPGMERVSWSTYSLVCFPAMMLVIGVCNLLLYLLY